MSNESINVVKGVTLSPPIIGRITMGHTVIKKKGGESKALPTRDDFFGLTTLVQNGEDRSWERHALEANLTQAGEKLRAIPVRVAFNDKDLNLVNRYSAFDRATGRILCAGNGESAKRATDEGVQDIVCPRPEGCEFAQRMRCKNMTRAYFRIDGQDDELGVFVLRTTSFNSLSYLASRFNELNGLTGGRMANMPLMLLMRSKTTTQSMRTPFQFADLVQRPGVSMIESFREGQAYQAAMQAAGLSVDGMEAALKAGMSGSEFIDQVEDTDEWLSDEELADAFAAGSLPLASRQSMPGLEGLSERLKGLNKKELPQEPEVTQGVLVGD